MCEHRHPEESATILTLRGRFELWTRAVALNDMGADGEREKRSARSAWACNHDQSSTMQISITPSEALTRSGSLTALLGSGSGRPPDGLGGMVPAVREGIELRL